MEEYIGTHIVKAEPMTLGDYYNKYRGWTIPEDEDPESEGYLVKQPNNYVTWTAKEIFEEFYVKTENNNLPITTKGIKEGSFEWALLMLKSGVKVQRKNWNGKSMFIYLTTGTKVPVTNIRPDTAKHLFGDNLIKEDITIKINSHIDMKTADGSITIGWAPSQVDMLAEDWQIFK